MPQQTPWWVAWLLIGLLVMAAFVFVLLGKLDPRNFLAFTAALGVRAPAVGDGKAQSVDVQGEDVTVTESQEKDAGRE